MDLLRQTEKSQRTWFILGHEPLLSAAEIFSFTGRNDGRSYELKLPILKVDGVYDGKQLIEKLGGTIKIGNEIASGLTDDQLNNIIEERLGLIEGKITFGISLYSKGDSKFVEELGKKMKKILKARGRAVRYVYKSENVLSSATVEHNDLVSKGKEFLVQREGDFFSLAETTGIQNFENFSRRDYGRPGRDDVSGMLPPKLALMMINLSEAKTEDLILDPFCGSGTIITEAMLLGYKDIYGSDLSGKAVADTLTNIEWTKKSFPNAFHSNTVVKEGSAGNLPAIFPGAKFNSIITEPYLGKPLKGRESAEQIKKQTGELSGLYIDAFNSFRKVLSSDGTVIFICPRFKVGNDWVTISDRILPELLRLGFKPESTLPASLNKEQFLLYYRPGQHLGREVWKFTLN